MESPCLATTLLPELDRFDLFPVNMLLLLLVFFFQAEAGIRDKLVPGVQTCALPISGEMNAAELRNRVVSVLRKHLCVEFFRARNANLRAADRGAMQIADELIEEQSAQRLQIGRASCRERVEVSVVVGPVQKAWDEMK